MAKKLTNLVKRVTGTSLESKGFEDAPKADSEIGSAAPVQLQEIVPELATRFQRTRTYQKMLNSDSASDASLRTVKVPVLGAEFYIEPFNGDQENLDVAEFCDFNIFRNLNSPWEVVLQDILHFFDDGFSIVEPVWSLGEWAPSRERANRKKFTMLKKLPLRPANTLKEFQYDDNGGPNGIIQNAIRADKTVDEVPIPINKLMIFTLNGQGGDLEGRSILRTAYPHWYYKTHFYKIDAIQKERHGIGVPDIQVPASATPADKKAAHEMASNLRTNEKGYIVRPLNWIIGFAKPEGNMVNVLESADHHNAMIMLNVLAQFLLLGTEGGGSGGRATSASQLDMFMKSLRFVANLVCAYFNLYLLPKLVAYNFPTDRYPQMKARNIGEARDLQMLAAALANLADKELITLDEPTEQWVRTTFDMPRKIEPRPVDTSSNGKVTGPGDNSNDSTVAANIKTGTVGKAPTEG